MIPIIGWGEIARIRATSRFFANHWDTFKARNKVRSICWVLLQIYFNHGYSTYASKIKFFPTGSNAWTAARMALILRSTSASCASCPDGKTSLLGSCGWMF